MPVDVDALVLGTTRLSADYNVVELAAPAIAEMAQPGQFVMVRPSGGIDPLLRRPFSVFDILRDTGGNPVGISLLNKRVGVTTGRLLATQPGERFQCLGPLGRPFDLVNPPTEAWMVAGGVGLAPFVTLADHLAARGTLTTLFYGARTGSELFCLDRFESRPCDVYLSTEDGSRGAHGFVTTPLASALDRCAEDPQRPAVALYACGPTPMMEAVARVGQAHGCHCQVSLEPVMGCGLGGCYSCVVAVRDTDGVDRYVRSCLEGPVFDATRLVWERLVAH